MEQKGILHSQIPYSERLNAHQAYDIYKMKTNDLMQLVKLNNNKIEEIRDAVRKHKQFIKCKLQRQNLWKYIHLPT